MAALVTVRAVVRATAETKTVPVMVVRVMAAARATAVVRAIPVEINPVAVVRAMPQSHQRNSLL